ncbi:MAG: ThiF family adenylyltransferase [Chloroflexi bacterium]|nr:ThiF family adenylyltransferase [Chloroflexota bacterium]
MSNSPIDRSPDLKALTEVGFPLELRGAYLVVKNVPYLKDAAGQLARADMVMSIEFPDGSATPPGDHTVWWTGKPPFYADGSSMEQYLSCGAWPEGHGLGEGLTAYMQWSRKPVADGKKRAYVDYEEKVTTYIAEVAGQADIRHPGVLEAAKTGEAPTIALDSRFKYIDTNTYRYGLKGIEQRIEDEVVAIVGVGGTGSYLMDILAKTNVKELHLFDKDVLKQHNAFRMCGAARIEELGGSCSKVDWYRRTYSVVREQGVFVHTEELTGDCRETLAKFTTVFIAVDDLTVRRGIQAACIQLGVYHVSVGIGVEVEGESNDQLGGNVKVETSFRPRDPRPTELPAKEGPDQAYGIVQTVELNMLGAALAVLEWKARVGIYRNDRPNDMDTVLVSASTGRLLQDRKGNSPS